MGENRKFAYNVIASVVAFFLSTCISFFLTPYIVRSLGTAAYGFIGLSNSIISYTALITVALNAMAGRFISISYLKGNVTKANQYYSSVFFSNCILGGVILILAAIFVCFINKFLDVPDEILTDVRILFSLLVCSTIIGLVTNMYGISMFIRNELYLSSIRGIIGSIMGSTIIACAFIFFKPHVWYIGLNAVIITSYTAIADRMLHLKLTPDLRINIKSFDFSKVRELISAGSWNIINKLSDILGQGMDLLFANIFVGAGPMGKLSISKALCTLCLGLFGSISGNYGPNMTKLYAEGKMDELVDDFKKSMRVLSCFSAPILCSVVILCKPFYHLWMPEQDSSYLQILTCFGLMASLFSFPMQALWNIFTITNKLKFTSLSLLLESTLAFISIIVIMHFVHNPYWRLVAIVIARSGWGLIRNMTLLPLYGAYCLHRKIFLFYPTELKTLLALGISLIVCLFITNLYSIDSWVLLFASGFLTAGSAFILDMFIVLEKNDRKIVFGILKSKLHISL